MITRNMRPADVMEAAGRSRLDYTLQEALNRSRKPRPELVEDLFKWLKSR
jgi:hypothetical protein